MVLYLRQVAAGNGVKWARNGWAVFRRKPFALMALYSFSCLALALPGMVFQPLGTVSLMLLPLLSLAFMLASHVVVQGGTPALGILAIPFKITAERRRAQLWLGVGYGLLLFVAMQAAHGVDATAWQKLVDVLSQPQPDPQAVAAAWSAPGILGSMALMALAVTVLQIPFWHAPALVHWGGHGVAQALFSSTLAIWRNRGAFAIYALVWLGIGLAAGIVLDIVALLLGDLALPLLFFAGLVLSTAFYSSLYFSFVDCFVTDTPEDISQSA